MKLGGPIKNPNILSQFAMASYFKLIPYGLTLLFIFSTFQNTFASSQEEVEKGKRKTILLSNPGPLPREQPLKKEKILPEELIYVEDHLTPEQHIPCIINAWKKAVTLEKENPDEASTFYERAAQHYMNRIKLFAGVISEEDYVLGAGICWITALSLAQHKPEKASQLFELAATLLSYYWNLNKGKNNNPMMSNLISLLFFNASKLIIQKSPVVAAILSYKADCFDKQPHTLKPHTFSRRTVYSLTVGRQVILTIPLQECIYDLNMQSVLLSKAVAYSTIAALIQLKDPLKAIELYEVASNLGWHSVESSEKPSDKNYLIIADSCWNAAVIKVFLSSSKNEFFEKSLQFYTLWLEHLKDKATAQEFEKVAQAYSLIAQLYAYKFPSEKHLIKHFEKRQKEYFSRFRSLSLRMSKIASTTG